MTPPTRYCIACGFRHPKSFKTCVNKTKQPAPPLPDLPSLFDTPPDSPVVTPHTLGPDVSLQDQPSAIQQQTDPSPLSIQARFEEFHRLNPWVYDAFVKLAHDYMRRGYPRVGIGHLTEILRWQRRMETYDPSSEFKISNDYRSRYARLIMRQEPGLDGFITIRSLRTE